MNLPLSVVIPVYNAEDYLQMSVGAILSQTFRDFELILVNDGSTDRSGEICEEFAKNDSRVKVFHKPNLRCQLRARAYGRKICDDL